MSWRYLKHQRNYRRVQGHHQGSQDFPQQSKDYPKVLRLWTLLVALHCNHSCSILQLPIWVDSTTASVGNSTMCTFECETCYFPPSNSVRYALISFRGILAVSNSSQLWVEQYCNRSISPLDSSILEVNCQLDGCCLQGTQSHSLEN